MPRKPPMQVYPDPDGTMLSSAPTDISTEVSASADLESLKEPEVDSEELSLEGR
jgi:hypothetical protein